MKKAAGVVMAVLAGSVILAGCETVKGMGKDADNTGDHISRGVNAVLEADRKFQEKYW